jgi:hypothetical protein
MGNNFINILKIKLIWLIVLMGILEEWKIIIMGKVKLRQIRYILNKKL